jgi:hypothetical protein
MVRKPTYEELGKRVCGKSYFLEAEEGTGRKNAPNHAFLNRTQEIKYE